MAKVVFKALSGGQMTLFPERLDSKIPSTHPVRLINAVVDQLNIDDILSGYKGGGTSSFHPRMMIKVLFYAYFSNVYSCRHIAQLLEENIHFMWIAGGSTPDFRTINDFRSRRLKDKINDLFSALVLLIAELGYVSLEKQFVDGTKIEATSNKYTFVWRGSVEKNKAKLQIKLQSVLGDIEQSISTDRQLLKEEDKTPPIDRDLLERKIKDLNERRKELNKKQQKQLDKIAKDDLPRLDKYDDQLATMGDRNSYSKTDPDVTFMRMKEDHMLNGQLKPGYNVQLSSENQFATHFGLYQKANDTNTLIPHLEGFKQRYGKHSQKIIADAGYGSEENYEYLLDQQMEAFVKYGYFHKEQKRTFKKNPFLQDNLFYNTQENFYVCPMGQRMHLVYKGKRTSDNGYTSLVSYYQAMNCEGCPMRGKCHKAKGNRTIQVNHRLQALKRQARERLLSEEGIKLRKRRCCDVEPVFGQLKNNGKYDRFRHRGIEKITMDLGLALIGHNLRKLVVRMAEKLRNQPLLSNLSQLMRMDCIHQNALWAKI